MIRDGRQNVNVLVLKQEFGGTRLAPKTMKITKIPYVQVENGEPAVMAIGEDITEYVEKEKRVKEKLETLQLANGKLKTEKANAHSNTINSVAYNNDGTLIVSGSYDQTIKVWDGEPPTPPNRLSSAKADASCVSLPSQHP